MSSSPRCNRLCRSALVALACLVADGCSASENSDTAADRSEAAKAVAAFDTRPQAPTVEPSAPPKILPAVPARPLHGPGSAAASSRDKPASGIAKPVPASFANAEDAEMNPRRNPLRTEEDSKGPANRGARAPDGESTAHAPAQKKADEAPFDPIKENGKFFEDWPKQKPKLALIVTGRQDGYLEPCGCAGLEKMKGGLMRRQTFFQQMRQDWGWPVVAIDVGGLIKGFGRQAELKFQTTVNSLQKMGYDAIAFGRGELRLPTGELVSVAAGAGGKPSPFVSANVGLFGLASGLTSTKRIVEAGGRKVGITAVLGIDYQKEIHNADIEMAPPDEAIRKVLPELKKEGCDLLILLAHATTNESVELAKTFPEFDVVVTAGGVGEPPRQAQKIGEKTLLVEVGEKGAAAVVLGFFDTLPRVLYQSVLFDSRYPPDPDIKAIFAAYQGQLKDMGLAGLGVRQASYPRREIQGAFVGSAKCEPCHEESYKVWKKSGHAHAYATLVKGDPPRNFDPECISCHVIGWDPTKHFPYETGFLSKEKTPQLLDVGCESCHGAGGAHCDAEVKNDKALQEKLQKAMVVTKAESEKRLCMSCHDLDNSPHFDFPTYWPKVEHREK